MKNVRSFTRVSLIAIAAALGATTFIPMAAVAADLVLSGAIQSAGGEKMGGAAVSAKGEGQTITTTVFTDESGSYYFPPMPAGANIGSGRRRSPLAPQKATSILAPQSVRTSN